MDLQDLVTIPPNELQKGGFGFELVKRNEILDRLGMKSPTTKKPAQQLLV